MSTDDLQKYYRFRSMKWIGPWYYDYPDGEDLPGKLSFCGKASFLISATVGLLNAYTVPPYPTTHRGRFARLFRAVVPGVGMGFAFATTTYYMTRIRQKDDAGNHFVGGIAAGAVCGAANGLPFGFIAAVVLGSVAGMSKLIHENVKTVRPHTARQLGPFLERKKDLSGLPSGKGNWVKAPPPQN